MGKKGRNWRPPASRPSQPRDPQAPVSNREARRIEAQRRREEIRRREAKRRRTIRILGIVGALVVVAGVVLAIVLASGGKSGSGNKSSIDPHTLAGIQQGAEPWPAETTHLNERIRQIGLPGLGVEQLKFHIHSHLDLFVHGQPVSIPAGIGIQGQTSLAVIHTHDDSGVIHVESPIQRTYTLGDFFDVWGVLFTKDCVGGYCGKGGSTVKVFVNGKPFTGNPREVPLRNLEEIVVAFGTADELPKPIPTGCTSDSCLGVGFAPPATPTPSASASPSGSASPSASGGSPSAPSSASPSASSS